MYPYALQISAAIQGGSTLRHMAALSVDKSFEVLGPCQRLSDVLQPMGIPPSSHVIYSVRPLAARGRFTAAARPLVFRRRKLMRGGEKALCWYQDFRHQCLVVLEPLAGTSGRPLERASASKHGRRPVDGVVGSFPFPLFLGGLSITSAFLYSLWLYAFVI